MVIRRVRAAKAAGVKMIPAWIPIDLTGRRAVDKRFIVANLNRSQMSKLDQARAYQELKGVQAGGGRDER